MTMLAVFVARGAARRRVGAPAGSRKVAGWISACLALLLFAQFLGLVHGVVHSRSGGVGDVHALGQDRHGAASPELGPHAPQHAHGGSPRHEAVGMDLLASVFDGHEDGDPSCQVFDALGHHAVWLLPSVAIAGLPDRALLRAMQGAFVARWAALYDARGPPTRA